MVERNKTHHQFLEEHMDLSLANSINDFFVDLTNDFEPLTTGGPAPYVPELLLVTQHEVYRALSSINTSKAVGPDNIPTKLLKDFAFEVAPVIQDIYNHRQPYPQRDPPPPQGFTITKLLPELDNKIDVGQYAIKGHSTTDALLYLLLYLRQWIVKIQLPESSLRTFLKVLRTFLNT